MRVIKLKKMKRINGVHHSPDGRRLLVCGGVSVRMVDDAVWIDVAKGEEVDRFQLRAQCYAVTADLTKLAIGNTRDCGLVPITSTADIRWFDLEKAKPEMHELPIKAEFDEVFGLAFSLDGETLAVSCLEPGEEGGDGTLSVWSIRPTPRRINSYVGSCCSVISFHPSNTQVAFSGGGIPGEPEVWVVNLRDRKKKVSEFKPKGTQTRQLVYSPSGDTLAVVNGRNVYLLPAGSNEPRLTLGGHPKQVNAVTFSPDSTRILSACHDKLVRVWDAASGQLIQTFDWGLGAMTAITYAPDGLTAAAGGEKGQVIFWDTDG